ncbi:MAG: EAL domain-containing response regulator [Alphaproteobacteria bacterium]
MDKPAWHVNVLVVDDDAQICELFEDIAEEAGITLVTVSDYVTFQQSYGNTEFDAIFLDLQMPDVDGVEYLRLLGDTACAARVTLMSGFDARVLRTARRYGESRRLRMEGVLEKPFDIDLLADLLKNLNAGRQLVTHDDLQHAIGDGQLFLQYQPKVRLDRTEGVGSVNGIQASSGRWPLHSLEALVRWRHPVHGRLAPDRFIPLAESSQLIIPLTEFVMREAVRQMAEWEQDGFISSVCINWPAHMLTDLSAPDRLARLVDDNGVDRERIVLEVTETTAMQDAVQAMDILSRIRLKGFHLAMDDFGTGYSSLVQLHRMPFSELKIDKSIVMEMSSSDDAAMIVHAIIDLAHNLGLNVCAEGTEDAATVRQLRGFGCDFAQGFHFAPATDGQDIPLLAARPDDGDPLDDAVIVAEREGSSIKD